MSETPDNRPPVRRLSRDTGDQIDEPYRPQNPPPRRDMGPLLIGGLIGALALTFLAVMFLMAQRGSPTSTVPVPPPTAGTANSAGAPTAPADTGGEPPRISMDEFKALYDDPAKRPIIIDVRDKGGFDAGHIKGAISFPESELEARISELPKDKLVVTYCA